MRSKTAFFILIIIYGFLFSLGAAGPLKFSDNPELHKRAITLSGITGEKTASGTYISEMTFERYLAAPEALASNCAFAGIKEVILPFRTQLYLTYPEYAQSLIKQIKGFHERGISVSALLSDDISLLYRTKRIENIAAAFSKFQKEADDGIARFDAVSLDILPDSLRTQSRSSGIPKSFPWRWNDKSGWGESNSNDMLMKAALNCIGNARIFLRDTPLSATVKPSYFEDYKKNRLSCGSISDFMMSCEYLIIPAYSDNPDTVLKLSNTALRECVPDGGIAICVKTDGRAGALSFAGMDWKLFCSAMKSIMEKASSQKSFRGIIFSDYDGLEKILMNGLENNAQKK
ncbi:MAG: hypothetical protein A2017_05220 [Lentisphaerae bacterium GWF2_44_16]|nr:MAG: hypothetical protein A2017_05220 [Lentisphaerae bacterium GWF2_44_16]